MEQDNQDTKGPGCHEEYALDPASFEWDKVWWSTAGPNTEYQV